MKVVILAGGLGTRLGEETSLRPKPMVEIGGYPILWHIMKIYSHYGFNDFVILTGYKQECIKEYFVNYYLNHSDVTVDLSNNSVTVHKNAIDPWKVTMVYTGRNTMTGSRIKKAKSCIGNDTFMLTYGDGVSDVNIRDLIEFHNMSGKICTLTSVQPAGRFGYIEAKPDGTVTDFKEKPRGDGSWINGGFMVCNPAVLDYIPNGDNIIWEHEPLTTMATERKLGTYHHHGFWKPMDTMKDKADLNAMWESGKAPWKIW